MPVILIHSRALRGDPFQADPPGIIDQLHMHLLIISCHIDHTASPVGQVDGPAALVHPAYLLRLHPATRNGQPVELFKLLDASGDYQVLSGQDQPGVGR